ncbi:putative glyoxalase superfamily protein PhnB [Pseudonocardia hierapolitana]|uniref:Putative glyoxalase superfamily protein PhnB n=1 Tax=Pseudonocardia hierapolitana TaxID=1128676 RepID=A0A561SXQ3_9PSEU|nr:VOC family protein [Pseudonocardia hierapolitana]TWF79648.1 putative glyoxalase superfamily protein PhnB [Pseudonocardia hierapolitana]
MTDPFDALRSPSVPVAPDPGFARALRARIERALLATDGEPAPSEGVAPHAVTPYLTVADADEAIALYADAFGARRRGEPIMMPDGRIGHAEIVIGDSVLMLAEEFPEMDLLAPVHRGGASQSLHVEVPDPDAAVERAVARGGVLERPVADGPYGRGGVVRDPSGHRWMVSAPSGPRPGQITYAAFWTRDVARADRFYGRVLGWRTVPSPNADGLPTRQVSDLALPLGLRATDRAPTLAPYYAVPDVDAAAELVRAAGGTAAEPGDRSYGRAAECVDDQGLPFTLVAPSGGGPRRSPDGPGELDYALLRVPDTTRARAFYGTVLGWRFRPGTGPGYWHPEVAGGPSAPGSGLEGGHADAVVVPWFRVPDLDTALTAVQQAGGRAVGPVRHQRGGPRIECIDDQGARFGLAQL